MNRRPIEAELVDARWRLDVGNDTTFSLFDVVIDGRTHPMTAEATRKLVGKLTVSLEAAERYADQETARAAQAGR